VEISMDIQTIWNIAFEEIKTQVSKPSFETWFKTKKPISLEENTFVLATPHAFAADWLMSRYGNLIEEVLRGITGNPEIKFKTVYPKRRK
jgi:chromosomal replication initiator protein